jgi:diguanylate cyclase
MSSSADATLAGAATAAPAPEPDRRLSWLLGDRAVVRAQVTGTLISATTYVLYVAVGIAQVALGLLAAPAAWALGLAALLLNAGFYAAVRSGRFATGRDPGLARTQLVAGVLLMFPSYALLGPAATGLLVVMASHVVYSMFMMRPRQVWLLVGATLAGLALTMFACHQLWPARYAWPVQVSGLLYALVVMPLIAVLAHRITRMTTQLKAQRAELQAALARLQELATRDELTRTHNRRHMTELLHEQQVQHRRLGTPMALALIDIDLFKTVNDRHGHAAGDEVLRSFAALVREHLRAHDLLARWGGEEFLVLLPHTPRADARHALDRLQEKLAAACLGAMPHGLSISFSAGVVELAHEERLEAAIERADQAMYRAKTLGRGRCVEA